MVVPLSLREPDMVVWWWVRDCHSEMAVVVVGEEGEESLSHIPTFV